MECAKKRPIYTGEMSNEIGFSFGKNWERFIKEYYSPERLLEAKKSLARFLGTTTLKNKIFIDVGCGTGMFSLAAFEMGAKEIISVDVDPSSIRCAHFLRESRDNPDNWTIKRGSLLDESFLQELKKGDVVYSWGVLHHTGNMKLALDNVTSLVKSKGLLYIAIYNKKEGVLGSHFWLSIKKIYNKSPGVIRWCMENGLISAFIFKSLLTFKNPFSHIFGYKKKYRGMSYRRDISDWLGGYPYEFASPRQLFLFYKKRGFSLENMTTYNTIECNEFLFKKQK